MREIAVLRLARTHAVQTAVQAVDLMYTDAGGAAIYTRNPLERCFRDIHAVTQHVSMNPASYEVSGCCSASTRTARCPGCSAIIGAWGRSE